MQLLKFCSAIVYHNTMSKSSEYRQILPLKLILNCASFRLVKTVLFAIVFYFTQWYNHSLTARLIKTKEASDLRLLFRVFLKQMIRTKKFPEGFFLREFLYYISYGLMYFPSTQNTPFTSGFAHSGLFRTPRHISSSITYPAIEKR